RFHRRGRGGRREKTEKIKERSGPHPLVPTLCVGTPPAAAPRRTRPRPGVGASRPGKPHRRGASKASVPTQSVGTRGVLVVHLLLLSAQSSRGLCGESFYDSPPPPPFTGRCLLPAPARLAPPVRRPRCRPG